MSGEAEVSQGLIDRVNHLFDEYGPWGTLEYVIDAYADVREANRRATLSPPGPVKRLITEDVLRAATVNDLDTAIVVDIKRSGRGYGSRDARGGPLSAWVHTIIHDHYDPFTFVIEVPAGHPLATCGEATDE